ncbi:MAG: hypothetical protein KGJ32_08075 [Xanthomonadaceae bacterium]|nr:hypothetical protein [Xanthomonadaceae bacterium]
MFYMYNTPRSERTIAEYFDDVLTRTAHRCVDLGYLESAEQFDKRVVEPTWNAVADGLTGDEIFQQARAGLGLDFMPDDRLLIATMCAAYACEALMADKAGDTVTAWTYMLDAVACREGVEGAARELEVANNALSFMAKKAANALHDKPGGSRSRQQEMRDIWASGKYTNRDRCAEEECGALGISFSAARKALRKTPNPT